MPWGLDPRGGGGPGPPHHGGTRRLSYGFGVQKRLTDGSVLSVS